MVMTECPHSFIHSFVHQIITEYLLCARNFVIKKLILAIRKIDVDPSFMEFTVQLGDWQMNNYLLPLACSLSVSAP